MSDVVDARHADDARRAVEAVWRIESAKLIAVLARMVGDFQDLYALSGE